LSNVEWYSKYHKELYVMVNITYDVDQDEEAKEYERMNENIVNGRTNKRMLYEDILRRKEQNLEFQRDFDIQIPASELLTKDVYGFDILRLDLNEHPKFKDSYIMHLSFNFGSVDYAESEMNKLLENAKYNVSFGDLHLVFYGDFIQNSNLIIDSVILPVKLLYQMDGTFVNIININPLIKVIDKVYVNISVSEVLFSEEMENRITKKGAIVEQYYERSDGTFNHLNTGSGMGGNEYAKNIPKDQGTVFTYPENIQFAGRL